MESTNSSAVQVARLEVEVEHLKAEVEGLKASIALVTVKVDAILEKLSEAKGGWRTLMWLGGASATAGGFVSWAVTHIKFTS